MSSRSLFDQNLVSTTLVATLVGCRNGPKSYHASFACSGIENGPKSYHIISYGSLVRANLKFKSYQENLIKESPFEIRGSKS